MQLDLRRVDQDLNQAIMLKNKRSKQDISRMTTQGSYSSTRFGGKANTVKSRESYIKYLAEHKDR